MERFNRAERRRQTKRLKYNRKNYHGWGYSPYSESADATVLGMLVTTPQRCSCLGCGNQRRYYGRTFPEICQEITEKEGLQDLIDEL